MSKELELYQDLMIAISEGDFHYLERNYQRYKDIGKSLKALEIIKEKKINVVHILSFTINSYNRLHNDNRLTEEEFDLLKEVLK